MPPDSRQKYQVNIALSNGQAFELITMMPITACIEEIKRAKAEGEWAKFDALNPNTDAPVSVQIDAMGIAGIVHQQWVRPQPQRGAMPPVPPDIRLHQ